MKKLSIFKRFFLVLLAGLPFQVLASYEPVLEECTFNQKDELKSVRRVSDGCSLGRSLLALAGWTACCAAAGYVGGALGLIPKGERSFLFPRITNTKKLGLVLGILSGCASGVMVMYEENKWKKKVI